ncbi:speckle-type POZ protein-like [Trichonephila clavata]|uniref:Speckle-type POZ protein-like n=1 Tax=Trichonephila clavata TaxID=2740835 RepID=A0A8X6LXW5_TRICU|nr:speckle-type POZ protein-like [Trichonephila clavata]
MDGDGFSENKCFTYTWNIENFSYSWQKNGECISSPIFILDTMEKTKWRLELYPKGCLKHSNNFISFFLKRESACRGPEQIDLYFDLSFLATDYSVLTSKGPYRNSFFKGKDWGLVRFVEHEEVLKIRRKGYLPENVLTARCRIWYDNEANNYGHYFARTRIAVERRSFVWNITQFRSFQESVCEIASASAEQSVITLKFFPSSGQNSETFIRVEVCAHDPKLKISTFRIYLMDTSGNKTKCLNDEILFYEGIRSALFTLTFSKNELMRKKNLYLLNDILQLYCECDIATGIMLDDIETISYGCPPSIEERNLTCDDLKSIKMHLNSTRILKENLESSYRENLFCDTKLKTITGSFPAHKSILSARSPVFKAMFTHNMREKNSEYVYIEDLNDDTVQRLLQYIYTATLLDLQWDSACNLFAAADKYEILSLKSECSSFLKDNLSRDNACDLLILADRHQDKDLNCRITVSNGKGIDVTFKPF